MAGMPITPSKTIEAPITPVEAAGMIPIIIIINVKNIPRTSHWFSFIRLPIKVKVSILVGF